MRTLVAALLLLGVAARAQEESAPAKETQVAQVTPATLPPVASAPKYGSPASLPPVTAQLFQIGGLLEVEPIFAFSIGDPFWRTMALGVRVEHHFDAYISLGPELVRELIAPDAASPETGRWALGGRISIGERLFISNRFMVRIAASELIYSGRVRGISELERKLSIETGVAWLFGGGR